MRAKAARNRRNRTRSACEKCLPGVRLRRFIHPLLIKLLSLRRSFSLHIEGEIPKGPCIFTANHQGIDDIPTSGEVIHRHAFVLVSDEDKTTASGLVFKLNGVIWVHRKSKTDRNRARCDIVKYLQSGESVLMFPEATWNLAPDLLMLPMNWGAVKLSKEADVPICPIYLLFVYEERACYAKIGEPYFPLEDDVHANRELRNRMASMCWDLMEKRPLIKRFDLPEDISNRYLMQRIGWYPRAKKDPKCFVAYESQFIFHPKEIAEHAQVFSHFHYLPVNTKTAFLFNKRLQG